MKKLFEVLHEFWNGFLYLLVFAVCVIAGVVGKNLLKSSSTQSPVTVASQESSKKAFIDACVTAGTDNDTCECYFTKIIEKFSFEKFSQESKAISHTGIDSADPEFVQFALTDVKPMCSKQISNTADIDPDENLTLEIEKCKARSENHSTDPKEIEALVQGLSNLKSSGNSISDEQITNSINELKEQNKKQAYSECLDQIRK